MHIFSYKCSLNRIYLIEKFFKKGKPPVALKKNPDAFSYFIFETFLLCDCAFICVGLQHLKTATGCDYHGLEMQLDLIFQESSVTAIYQLTNSASFFF